LLANTRHDRSLSQGFFKRVTESLYLAVSCRFLLGGALLLAGFGKLPNIWEVFIGLPDVLRILHIPESLWQFIHLEWLPWIEISVGGCLIAGLLLKPAAAISVVMTAGFLVFNTVKLLFPTVDWCNCFGVILQLSPRAMQVFDVVLLMIAVELLLKRGMPWSLDGWFKSKWPRYPLWGGR
jgi:uncharacterized membrane protein YphA (DoxX/SURF4 family)